MARHPALDAPRTPFKLPHSIVEDYLAGGMANKRTALISFYNSHA